MYIHVFNYYKYKTQDQNEWISPCLTILQTANYTQCACYNISENIGEQNSMLSFVLSTNLSTDEIYPILSTTTQHPDHGIYDVGIYDDNFLLFDEGIEFGDIAGQLVFEEAGRVYPAAILFVVSVWSFALCIWCGAPMNDDVPLISKNVIIPSLSKYY